MGQPVKPYRSARPRNGLGGYRQNLYGLKQRSSSAWARTGQTQDIVVENDCGYCKKSLHSFFKIIAPIFKNDCTHFLKSPHAFSDVSTALTPPAPAPPAYRTGAVHRRACVAASRHPACHRQRPRSERVFHGRVSGASVAGGLNARPGSGSRPAASSRTADAFRVSMAVAHAHVIDAPRCLSKKDILCGDMKTMLWQYALAR
jgi:hypothetical protein